MRSALKAVARLRGGTIVVSVPASDGDEALAVPVDRDGSIRTELFER